MDKNRKIIAISYSDDNYKMSKGLNLFTAKHIGKADEVISYGPDDLDDDFKKKYHSILSQKRGGGYWVWKPYIILKTMEQMAFGDFLIYTDAGMIYIKKIQHMIRQLDRDGKDIFLSSGFVPCKDWCKRDAFVLMGCDNDEAKNTIMVSGGYILLRKSTESIRFIEEFMKYAGDERIITDAANSCGLPNEQGFREHRHDQSVLSNLVWKYGIVPYRAVTHVDEPRAHINALRTGNPGAYKYTFEERTELMVKEHKTEGYQKSDYGRLFINTRLKDMSVIMFAVRLVYRILITILTDIWGAVNDKKYLRQAECRIHEKEEKNGR